MGAQGQLRAHLNQVGLCNQGSDAAMYVPMTEQGPKTPEIPPATPPEEPAPNEPPGLPPGQPEEIPAEPPGEIPVEPPMEIPPGSPPEVRYAANVGT